MSAPDPKPFRPGTLKRLAPLLALGACACAAVQQGGAAPASSPPPAAEAPAGPVSAESAARGNAAFGVALYRQLAGRPGNVFVSPISVAGAMGPVAAGAGGETRATIGRAMRFPDAGPALHPALGGLLRRLERQSDGVTLSIANALWLKQGFAIEPEFRRIARDDYDAAFEALDFEGAPQASADRINAWVDKETRGRIRGIVQAEQIDAMTRLFITNAVYFLGDWAVPFNAAATSEQPFHRPGAAPKTMPLMHRTGQYRYVETDEFQAIDLPYKDPNLSMSLLLPRAQDGLPALERQLDPERLGAWLAQLDAAAPREVRLFLPRLRIETKTPLNDPLIALGMGIAFTNAADFSNISRAQPLAIDQVVQKAFLKIDEKGTEAAAVTAVEIIATGARIGEPPTFRADRPFLLMIRDRPSGALLFLGRIVDPERV